MKWMSSYTRRTSDKLDERPTNATAFATGDGKPTSSSYKILDDREDDIDSVLISNILKKGSSFKGTELGLSAVSLSREGVSGGDRSGKDEGNENGEGEIDMKMLVSKDRKLTDAEIAKKILEKAKKTGKIFAQVSGHPSSPHHLSLSRLDLRELFSLSKQQILPISSHDLFRKTCRAADQTKYLSFPSLLSSPHLMSVTLLRFLFSGSRMALRTHSHPAPPVHLALPG
jgi:hypothetical protein